jgi:hypothetical protein
MIEKQYGFAEKSDCGKSLLARYLGNEKLRENNMEKMEPNFYTDNPSH